MHNRGASHASINTFLKYQFGASQSVSSGSITNICAAGRQHGDPRHRAPRTTARSLNAGHAAVLGGALDVDAWALTEELHTTLDAQRKRPPPGALQGAITTAVAAGEGGGENATDPQGAKRLRSHLLQGAKS